MKPEDTQRSSASTDQASPSPSDASRPTIQLPKGGGAIRGIGEKFAANPVTGTGAMSVPIATSPGRSGFGPQLSLTYDSGAGNGPFGFGWSLSLPAITRKTDKGLPQYLDAVDSDVFLLSGAEDLVPVYRQDPGGFWLAANPGQGFWLDPDGNWIRDKSGRLLMHEDLLDGYRVRRYRPRIEGLFARIERWSKIDTPGDVHWRSISKDNILTLYGYDKNSRIVDPLDATRIFSWLICESRDDKGNGIQYLYKEENGDCQLRKGQADPFKQAHQINRGLASDPGRKAQRYLQRILYGNQKPLLDAQGLRPRHLNLPVAPTDPGKDWLFEVRFDYGELDETDPVGQQDKHWFYRPDAFSSYRAGFEVRTCRRCERVLMLHHIPDQLDDSGVTLQSGYQGVVRSTEFTYDDELDPQLATQPVYSFLKQVTQSGWTQLGGTPTRRSLPPVEFEYTQPVVQTTVEEVDPQSLENLPIGLDGSTYRWTDLHGEGLYGILTEHGAWYYKRNLSPIPTKQPDGSEVVKAKFAPLETVALKPNVALASGAEIMDLAGDGLPDVVVNGPMPGLYEHDEAEGWQPFRPFSSRLNHDLSDPNLKLIDLDGDGHPDAFISHDDAFVLFPSLAEKGFGPARRVVKALDEEKGPRVVFADGTQSIYLADLSGDGLTDIVRIRNGEVCYWPSLGYGRFGAKVTMDNAPWFDNPDQFNQKRIRLADIDGSGTTDIIYLHRDGVRLYFNQSGNGWSQPHQLEAFPRIDDLASITPIDLLGNGTACLVWSSSLPGDARQPMRYVNLMGKDKPHLLVITRNNLGAETRVQYAPSTKFYLQDKLDGRPWITRLPFPVHVVERVETFDHISRNRFVTRYTYHHGYFDGEEREFRGFGRVEQWDTEQFAVLAHGATPADNHAAASHVPPVHTKTWFHTGAYLGRESISRQFESEYFPEPGLSPEAARLLLLDDTLVPPGLTPEEEREACRALKGSMLRQEVYADDADYPGATSAQIQRARTPYTVTEQNFTIRTLQARGDNRHAVFLTHACEAISYHYERNPADPRIQHALTLEVDDFGNVLKQAAIGYGRRKQIRVVDAAGKVQWVPNPGFAGLEPADQARQTTPLLTYTENLVTNAIDLPDAHRTPLPCEAITFELTGYKPTGQDDRYQAKDFVEADPDNKGRPRHKFSNEVLYEANPNGAECRRTIEWLRTLYRCDDLTQSDDLTLCDDLTGLLRLGALQPLALPGESYKLALTPGLIAQVYQRNGLALISDAGQILPVDTAFAEAGQRGGYVDLDGNGHWWIPSGRSYFSDNPGADARTDLTQARQHFFQPRRYRDPFGQDAFVDFDAYDLLMAGTRDALGNCVTVVTQDYRVLQPRLVSDPNGNRTEVAFDALGLVVGTAVMGKPLPAPAEGDSLAGFITDFPPDQIPDPLKLFIAAPRKACDNNPKESEASPIVHELLKSATTRIVYDLERFKLLGEPPFAATIARETHVSDLKNGQEARLQISISYSDGFGREIQKKIQAEPGPAPLRDPAGKIMLDAEGQPQMSADEVVTRWVGSGWTIFNNKGKPVRQYEPFFTDTHRFEFDVRVGVSPVLFYDPAERVIATLHPNHTYEKVVFDPWQQTTYDVNDTCARPAPRPDQPPSRETGDPRTDPDISGYVAEYFKTQPASWQTWHAQRLGGEKGTDEKNAAERAATHADTPTTAHFDALGRPFLTVARNRVVCPYHDLDGNEGSFATRVELDIEGNQRTVRDAITHTEALDETGHRVKVDDLLGRIVMRYGYDMLGNRIHQISMEAGARWMLNDVAGKPIRAWDSRGHNFSTRYDELRRPLTQTVRGTTPESDPGTFNRDLVVDRIEYGESIANIADAEKYNLRTRIYRHFDSAGLASNARLNEQGNLSAAYDFKGNLLRSTRRLVKEYQGIPDWAQLDESQLEDERFEASTRYDALNRPIQSVAPHSSLGRGKFNVIQPVFNESNLLERVDVWLESSTEPVELLDRSSASPVGISGIDYDAKGQRLCIDYKNGTSTIYDYDPLTFRLHRMVTRRGRQRFPGDCQHDPAWPGCQVQNLHYTYDPAGNITHIRDYAQQHIFFKNKRVEPSNDYVYDALYRLIQASGREHLGQGGTPIAHSYNDAGRTGIFSGSQQGLFAPNDRDAMGTYIERYVYDAVGNFLQMQHQRTDANVTGWKRVYDYRENSLLDVSQVSNRLSSTTVGNGPAEVYDHDAHGNMLSMPHLQQMKWDYKDQLRLTCRQRVNNEDTEGEKHHGEQTFYVYDASGQRVRKVTELANGGIQEERLYLGGFEVFRSYAGPVNGRTLALERETLHVMDDKQRIALMETRTLPTTPDPDDPQQLIRFQFGNHLGSASLELDEQAQIISYEEYAPYGSTTYQAVRSKTETAKRYRYTGKERDEESGLYYHGARYYAGWMGRWASCDPIMLSGGMNLVLYAKSNPIKFHDPNGRKPKKKGEFGDVNRHGDQGLRGKGTPQALESEHLDPFALQREYLRDPVTGESPIPKGRGSSIDRAQPTVMLKKPTSDAKTHLDKDVIARHKAESKVGQVTPATAKETGPEAGLERVKAAAKATRTAVPVGAYAAMAGQMDALHADPSVRATARSGASRILAGAADAELGAAVDAPLNSNTQSTGDLLKLSATKDPDAKTLYRGNYESASGGARAMHTAGKVFGGAALAGAAGTAVVQLYEGKKTEAAETVGITVVAMHAIKRVPALIPLAVMKSTIDSYDENVERHAFAAGDWVESMTGSSIAGGIASATAATAESLFNGTFGVVGTGIGEGAAAIYLWATE